MSEVQTEPGLGHNQPPEEFSSLDVDILKARLARDYGALAERVIEFEMGVEQAPGRVGDAETASRLTTWVAEQLRPLLAELVEKHKNEKRPYLDCGRAVDEYFLLRAKRMQTAIGTIERRVQVFHSIVREKQRAAEAAQRRRAAEEQQRAEAEQKRLAAEAEARAAANDRQGAARIAAEAESAGVRAEEAAKIVEAPSEPVRLHGDYGGTGFVRERVEYEVEDPTLVPLGFLTLDHTAIRAALDEGVREIPGLKIFTTEKFTIRRS